MPKLKPSTIIPTDEEDKAITAAADSDPDTYIPTDEEWERIKPALKKAGRPKAMQTKLPISIRLDGDIVDYFKSGGKGWQGRMNDALKEWIKEHER